MVPTSSLTGDLNVTVTELWNSGFPEDQELISKIKESIEEMVEKLSPVLAYVDQFNTQIGSRGIIVANNETTNNSLFLGRDKLWYNIDKTGVAKRYDRAWEYFKVAEVFGGLSNSFAEALKKKESHLQSVASRKDMLDRMMAAMRGEAVPAVEQK